LGGRAKPSPRFAASGLDLDKLIDCAKLAKLRPAERARHLATDFFVRRTRGRAAFPAMKAAAWLRVK
jgi:hypothetical protein